MRHVLLSVLVVAMTCGCGVGTRFDWKQARQVQPGMTKDEVASVMGSPYSTAIVDGREKWTWVYVESFSNATKSYSIPFDSEGRVASVPAIPDGWE